MMELTFHGAAGMVTGSCFLLEARGRRLLIDCGLFQGSKALNERNYGPFPFDPTSIDAVLLTHPHIDHSGLLPKLVRLGFKGPIYTTPPTKDLLSIMLSDSAHIQESEVQRLNKRRARQGQPLLEPIYRAEDAFQAVSQVRTREFDEWFPVGPDLWARFWPAGHMLGAASVIVEERREDKPGHGAGPGSEKKRRGPHNPTAPPQEKCGESGIGSDAADRSEEVRDGGIRSEEVWHGGIRSEEVWDGGIRSEEVWDGGIRSEDVRDGGIRSEEVRDGGIRREKVWDGGIRSEDVRDGAIRNEVVHRIVFSGDLGVPNQPLINDPAPVPAADTVVMESTYGHRARTRNDDRYERLADIVRKTFARGGNVVIPAFAVGRVQDLLYGLHRMIHAGELDPGRVFVDSPLAAKATDIFCGHVEEFDEEARRFAQAVGDCPLYFRELRITQSVEESRAINDIRSGALIISSSGMCDAGRIKHHLRHNLWRPECSVVIVSYQAEGTLGRRLVDGAKTVRIHGREVKVAAEIHNLDGFSAHADQGELVEWVTGMAKPPQRIFLVHGEPEARRELGLLLEEKTGVPVFAPNLDDRVDLAADRVDVPRARDAVVVRARDAVVVETRTAVPAEEAVRDSVRRRDSVERRDSFGGLWETVAALQRRLDELERSGAEEEDLAPIEGALTEARRWVERALVKEDAR